MAVFVVAMMSWTEGAHRSFISSSGTLGEPTWRDPEMAAYSAGTHSEHNVWPVATFHWTNDRQTLSTAAPVLVTNSTIP
jgi:hypothetical protein